MTELLTRVDRVLAHSRAFYLRFCGWCDRPLGVGSERVCCTCQPEALAHAARARVFRDPNASGARDYLRRARRAAMRPRRWR
ncbi:MAG: hypothetical protein KDD82_20315 [Planctomycetes bacterium]|nr:hypothetical protein [Planctomycetota bacterium]